MSFCAQILTYSILTSEFLLECVERVARRIWTFFISIDFFMLVCVCVCIVCCCCYSLESCLRFSFILQFYPEVPTCEILIREGQKEDFGEWFLPDLFRIQNCFFNNACLSDCLLDIHGIPCTLLNYRWSS